MPNINPDEFEQDMKDLDTRLRVLRAEYNQFLSGALQHPPNFTVAQIRKLIRKYAMVKGLKGMQRFQYFNMVARFNTMQEFFGRRMRDRSEGKRMLYGFVKSEQDQAEKPVEALKRQSRPERDKGHIVADVRKQHGTLKHMFDKWNELSSEVSKPLPPIDFDKFKSMIQSKTEVLCSKKGCKAVRYRMVVEDGALRIKAKPVK